MEAQAVQQQPRKPAATTRRQTRSKQEGQHASVQAVLHTPAVQAKLRIGRAEDAFEKEADRIAERAFASNPDQQRSTATEPRPPATPPTKKAEVKSSQEPTQIIAQRSTALDIQRLCNRCEEELRLKPDDEDNKLEQAGSAYDLSLNRQLAADIAAIRRTGLPLHQREEFEARLGYDFSQTRIHTDHRAQRLAERLGARAFTYGPHIVFGQGQYAPQSMAGKKLIAHELVHVVQQGAATARPPVQPSETITQTGAPQLQADLLDDAGRIWDEGTSAVYSGARAFGGAVVSGAEYMGGAAVSGALFIKDTAVEAYESARDLVIDYLERNAPGLLAFLRGDIIGEIKRQILSGLDYLFNGFGTQIQRQGLMQALRNVFGDLVGTVRQIVADLANGDCSSLFAAINTIAGFGQRLMGPAFDGLRILLSSAGQFFGKLWSNFASPTIEVLSDLAGSAWKWLSDQAQWLWNQTAGIRAWAGWAWDEFKELFNIAWDGVGDALSWLKAKALEAWNAIKRELGPLLLPLQIAGGIFLLFTPMAPVVIIGVGLPLLWQAIAWLRENWDDIGVIVTAREILNQHILPAIQSGLVWLQSLLQSAADWFGAQLSAISTALSDLINALSAVPVVRVLLGIVNRLASLLRQAIDWLRDVFIGLLQDIKQLALSVYNFLRPLAGLVAAIVLFPVFPFMLPVVLTGWAWRLAPDCVKPPIIDFFIDMASLAIEAMPDFANYGRAWPRAKAKILQTLQTIRSQDIDKKIAASNRVAKLMTGEDFTWIGNLIQAARHMPRHFMGQAQEELIGMNLTQPLPFEIGSSASSNPLSQARQAAAQTAPGLEQRLLSGTLGEDEVTVEHQALTRWHPQLLEEINLPDNGTYYIGDGIGEERGSLRSAPAATGTASTSETGNDTEARLQAMMAQPLEMPCDTKRPAAAPETPGAETGAQQGIPETMKFGPLSQGQRARYMLDRMGKGISHWFDCNKHWVVPSLILAIIALIALEILTEGAITAALPMIAEILGVIFVGVAFVRVGYYLAKYLSLGVAGRVTDSSKALARGLAVGAIELVFALLFNIGAILKSIKEGARASVRAAAGAARSSVRRGVDAVGDLGRTFAQGTKTLGRNVQQVAVRGSRVVLSGVRNGIGRGARSVSSLLRRLRTQLREFRGFRFKRSGRWLLLQALYNPWVTIARGQIRVVDEDTSRAIFLTDDELAAARRGGLSGADTEALRPFETVSFRTASAPRRGAAPGTGGRRGQVGDALEGDHIPSRAALEHAALEEMAGSPLTRAQAASRRRSLSAADRSALRQTTRDDAVTVALDTGDHAAFSRTYLRRNTEAQIVGDARDLGRAFQRDAESILKGLYNDGRLTPEIVGAYQRAYRENVRRGIFRHNPDVDEMMRDFLQRLHRRARR